MGADIEGHDMAVTEEGGLPGIRNLDEGFAQADGILRPHLPDLGLPAVIAVADGAVFYFRPFFGTEPFGIVLLAAVGGPVVG